MYRSNACAHVHVLPCKASFLCRFVLEDRRPLRESVPEVPDIAQLFQAYVRENPESGPVSDKQMELMSKFVLQACL